MEQKIRLLEIGPVAASKTVTVRLDQLIGRRIKSLQFQHGYASGTNTIAAAATNISELRFIVNDRVARRLSGTQLRDLNLVSGTIYDCLGVPNTAPGVSFPWFFSEPWRQDRDQRDSTAFLTVWGGNKNPRQQVSELRVEIDLGAASTPTLVASATVDDVIPDIPVAALIEHVPWSIPAASTKFDWALNRSGVLVALSLYQDSGGSNTASAVKLTVDEITRIDATYSSNFSALSQQGMFPTASGRTATITDLVFDHDDNLANALPIGTARSAVLTVEAASAMSGSITGIAQVIHPVLR